MKSVFITGASSGIGKELSLAYAKLGWCVGISARRLQLLEQVSEQAKDLSGQIFTYQLDVQDAEQCKVIAEKFIEQANGISCAIANAGIGGDDGLFSGTSSQINNVLNTNVLGVTNSLMPFIPKMKEQKNGTLVCISSVASYVPLPFHGGYASSKVAIRMIFDSWRPSLQKYSIKTVSICPGFIDTPIVKGPARNFPMVSADKAAKKFIRIIRSGKNTYVYPRYYLLLIFLVRVLPERIFNFIMKKMFHRPIN